MTAPGCIEFYENVVLIVDDYVLVIVSHDNLDWTFLLFGNGLRFDARVDLAINEVLDEGANIIVGELLALVKGEFLVLHSLLNSESGPLVHLEVQVTGVSAKRFGVNSREAERSLVLLCQWLESLSQLSALLWRLGEDVGERDPSLKKFSSASEYGFQRVRTAI